jgi:hypothetical protein
MTDSFKKGPIGHPEKSVINYNYTLHNISEGRTSHIAWQTPEITQRKYLRGIGFGHIDGRLLTGNFPEGSEENHKKNLGNMRRETFTTVSTRLLARDAV